MDKETQLTTGTPLLSQPINSNSISILDGEMLLYLECPECHEISIPPIYLCKKGHIICSSCYNNIVTCPICSERYTEMRSKLAESIVSSLNLSCRFHKQGCPVTLKGDQLADHLTKCQFRPAECFLKNCKRFIIPVQDFLEHLKVDHKISGKNSSSAIVQVATSVNLGLDNWTFPPFYLEAFDEIFLCNIHFSYNLFIAWISVYDYGQSFKEYPKFLSVITMFKSGQKVPQTQSKWLGPIHSFRKNAKEVFQTGKCLTLTPETFLLFNTVSKDKSGKTIKLFKCHFEIILSGEKEKETENLLEKNVLDKNNDLLLDNNFVSTEFKDNSEISSVKEDHENDTEPENDLSEIENDLVDLNIDLEVDLSENESEKEENEENKDKNISDNENNEK